jgi:hypothetical protein
MRIVSTYKFMFNLYRNVRLLTLLLTPKTIGLDV